MCICVAVVVVIVVVVVDICYAHNTEQLSHVVLKYDDHVLLFPI